MFSKRRLKHYGVKKEVFDSCFDIIQEGNDKSLTCVLIINALLFIVISVANVVRGRNATVAIACAVLASMVAVLFFLLGPVLQRYHHVFFYLATQVTLFYGVYSMSFGEYTSLILYPATVMVLPLFYMHNFYGTGFFLLANMTAFLLMAHSGVEAMSYMRPYAFAVVMFTFAGLTLHYVYQANRLRELINYRDSNEKQSALEITSNFEMMTGLLRRKTFIELAERRMKNREESEFMVIGILDIDHFKLINDTYGHQLGDETIATIGRVLAETLGINLTMPDELGFKLDLDKDYGNIASRLGGDEFIFLLSSEKDERSAKKLTQYLLDALNATPVGPLKSIEGSIGISVVGEGSKTYDQLYHEADMALYSVKSTGRNRVAIYDSNMEKAEKEENDKSDQDMLTGLLKAKAFREQAVVSLREKEEGTYAIVNLDIENFKSYNSQYGFEKGDLFLKKVAELLCQTYPDELIARFSDDHFVAMLPMEGLEHNISKIKFNLKKNGNDYRNAIRVGVFQVTDPNSDINAACDYAKFACDTIRGRYDIQIQYFDEELHKKSDRFQYIVEHLDEALAKEWITVYYQPIVRTYTGACCGLEALARWNDPDLGLLPPSDFIETLEQTHLIYKLDLYMVQHVCKHCKKSREEGKPLVPVSVNLSRLDFDSIDVIAEIESCIQEYDIPRNALHIEITESALMEQKESLGAVVDQFQKMDYEIWMDDFGSGYSSLNVLKDYHFNVIKFDMEFLKDTGIRARVVLTSIVDMAKKLGLQTLAEGVETPEQYEFLKSIGCEFVQGYLFSKPILLEEFYQKVEQNDTTVESMAEREFYNEIGKLNVLENVIDANGEQEKLGGNTKAISLMEWHGGKLKFLMVSPSYMRYVRKDGEVDLLDIEEQVNNREGKMANLFAITIVQAIASQKGERRILGYGGTSYMLYMKCLARSENSGKLALVSSFTEISDEK